MVSQKYRSYQEEYTQADHISPSPESEFPNLYHGCLTHKPRQEYAETVSTYFGTISIDKAIIGLKCRSVVPLMKSPSSDLYLFIYRNLYKVTHWHICSRSQSAYMQWRFNVWNNHG